MNRDELFRIAVLLVAPTLRQTIFGTNAGVKETASQISHAYNAALLAYSLIPERGEAKQP